MDDVVEAPRNAPQLEKVAAFASSVRDGLTSSPKRLESKYFYDKRGSDLFEQICELPEYYPTRTEIKILQEQATAIAAIVGADAEVVELGSGASVKTRILLGALKNPAAYVPVDISAAFMREAVAPLRTLYPNLAIRPVAADFTRPFELPAQDVAGWRLMFFPGSTIGNLHPDEAERFLGSLYRDFAPDGMIIGVDLKKDPAILRAAYNDSQGVTAAFNLNILDHINREVGGTLAPESFRHEARYDSSLGRIEMHLVCQADHTADVAGTQIRFRAGESIHTENSYKYEPAEFVALAARAGWRGREVWMDSERLFSVHLLVRE